MNIKMLPEEGGFVHWLSEMHNTYYVKLNIKQNK